MHMCVLSVHTHSNFVHFFHDFSYYSCVQIVNVSAFDETRNVIQCKLSDELEISRMNEQTNERKKEKKKIIPCVTHSSVVQYDTSSTSIGTSLLLCQRKICFSRVRKLNPNQNEQMHTTNLFNYMLYFIYNYYVNDGEKYKCIFLYIDLKSVASSLLFVSIFLCVFFFVCLFCIHSVVWVCCTIFTAICRFYLCNARIFSFFSSFAHRFTVW